MEKRKLNKSRVMVLGIVFYMIFYGFVEVIGMNVKTINLENKDYEFLISKKGLIIKDQEIIKSPQNGYFKSVVEEGEKVQKNQLLGYVYENEKEYNNVLSEVEKINIEINNLQNEIENTSSNTSQIFINKQIENKESELDRLKMKLDKSTEIYSNVSGKISFYFDEDENFDIGSLSEITKEDIENSKFNYENSKKNNKVIENEPILKIVNTNETFICIEITEDEVDLLEVGKSFNLRYEDNSIRVTVDDIHQKNGYYILIFRFIGENSEIYNTMSQNFDIIYKKIDSIRINKSSLDEIDDILGVYVVDHQNSYSKFIELKGIIFEDNDHIYIDYFNNRKNGIKTVDVYDKVILNPNYVNIKIKVK